MEYMAVPSAKKKWERLYKYISLVRSEHWNAIFPKIFLYCVAKGLCNRDDEMHTAREHYTHTMMYDARSGSSGVFKRVSSQNLGCCIPSLNLFIGEKNPRLNGGGLVGQPWNRIGNNTEHKRQLEQIPKATPFQPKHLCVHCTPGYDCTVCLDWRYDFPHYC